MQHGRQRRAFAPWGKTSVDAIKEEIDRQATGELTLRADDGIDARLWFEAGSVVGVVLDTMRGGSPEKMWDAICNESFAQRRFRNDVPRPDHIPFVKALTSKLLGRK